MRGNSNIIIRFAPLFIGVAFSIGCNELGKSVTSDSSSGDNNAPLSGNTSDPTPSPVSEIPPPPDPGHDPAPPPNPVYVPAHIRTVIDVTSHIEISIPPFNERYPANNQSGFRELTNIAALGDRVYAGHGSTNGGGPTDVWYFDSLQNSWIKESHITEEIIGKMRVKDGVLYLEGRDSMSRGNFYRRELTKGWQSYAIGPDGHPQDAYPFGNFVFTNTAQNTQGFPGIAIYNDLTQSKSVPIQSELAPGRLVGSYTEFFDHRGILYALGNGNYDPLILRFTPTNISAPWSVAVAASSNLKGAPLPDQILKVSDNLAIYTNYSYGLYAIHNIEDVDIRNVPLVGQDQIATFLHPIRGEDGYFYITGQKIGTTGNPIRSFIVYYSSDGLNWFQYTKFDLVPGPSLILSKMTAAKNGDLFFSYTTTDFTDKAPYPSFIRIRKEAIDGSTKPIVSLSLAQTEIWEASASKINLKLNRTGPTTSSLTVPLEFSGTAVNGTHYLQPVNKNIVIPAGQGSTSIDIDLVNNAIAEGDKLLTIGVTNQLTYTSAVPSSMTIKILDDDALNPAISPVGLKLWLRADRGVVTDGAMNVSEWQDQSPAGFKAKQLTAASRPVLIPSAFYGKPALRFDGVNDFLNVGSIADQVYFAAIVFKNQTTLQAASPSSSLINFMSYIEGGLSGIEFGGGSPLSIYFNNWVTSPPPVIAAAPHILTVSQPRHAALYNFKLDQGALNVASSNNLRVITLYGSDVRVGTRNGLDRFFKGDIAEIILYNRPLTTAEVLAVENYLSGKYH